MGKRYFCDYCEKSFPDNIHSRKKHNDGMNHRLMKEAHYKAFKDAKTLLQEEQLKQPCKRFFRGLECAYGNECRFSHFLPQDFVALQATAAAEERNQIKIPKLVNTPKPFPNVEAIGRKPHETTPDSGNQSIWVMDFPLPRSLANFPNLPPSLLPPMPCDLESGYALDWG